MSDLGDGWAPTELDNEEELNFLKEAMGLFVYAHYRPFFIGGTTTEYYQYDNPITFDDYIKDSSGEMIHKLISKGFMCVAA